MFNKITTSLMAAGILSCCLYFLYIDKKEITINQEDEVVEYNELSFEESDNVFKWEVVEENGELYVVVDDNTDDFCQVEEIIEVEDPEKTCYIYQYPKKRIHLI